MIKSVVETFVLCSFIGNKSTLDLVIAWRQAGGKPLPRSFFGNKSTLDLVIAWRQAGGKPLPRPMIIHFANEYMRQPTLKS